MSRGATCDCSGSWTTIGAVEPSVTTSRAGKPRSRYVVELELSPVESVARSCMVSLLVVSCVVKSLCL